MRDISINEIENGYLIFEKPTKPGEHAEIFYCADEENLHMKLDELLEHPDEGKDIPNPAPQETDITGGE